MKNKKREKENLLRFEPVSLWPLLTKNEINRLQRLQNKASKLIFMAKKYDYASPLIHQLHWLPVHKRIEFKTLTLVYKCVVGDATPYLIELKIPYQCHRTGLRSGSDGRLLSIPRTRLISADKGFYSSAPKLWNDLPHTVRHATSLDQFKNLLKTHLFWFCFLLFLVDIIFLFLWSAVVPFVLGRYINASITYLQCFGAEFCTFIVLMGKTNSKCGSIFWLCYNFIFGTPQTFRIQ